jgi:lipopolysaccharide transport system ATP-binding protein
MMGGDRETVIRVEGLGKRYRLGQREPIYYRTLRDSIARHLGRGLRKAARLSPLVKKHQDDHGGGDGQRWIWALKDVSFEVKKGEVVGIIGRNGAGKSTLLKILSRITEPTEGRVEMHGRVASLLEIGTGFHPELTGRENIYLNGAILGMKRAEIDRKFDEIVAFAELERFLDTPVKRYSSGMYVRLAFAVAAHLEPEILLVDEVLAVGDTAFQKKCLGKMGDVAHEGRTVVFVSHNMGAVENLCQCGIVLDRGQAVYIGGQIDAVSVYLRSLADKTLSLRDRTDRQGTGAVRVVGIEFRDTSGNLLNSVPCGRDIDVYLHFEAEGEFPRRYVTAGVVFKTQLDAPVFQHNNRLTGQDFGPLPTGGAFVCRLRRLPLTPSVYRVAYSIRAGEECLDTISDAAELTVVEGDFFGCGLVPPSTHGVCLVEGRWRLEADTPAPSI